MQKYKSFYEKYTYDLERINNEDVSMFHSLSASTLDAGLFVITLGLMITIYRYL